MVQELIGGGVSTFNVLVHCVLQGTSLCFYSILAQGLSFVRIHFSFLSAQPTVFFWTSVAGIDIDQLRFSWHADIFSVSWFLVLDSQTLGGPGRHGRSDGLGVITRTVDDCTSPHCQRVVPSISYPLIFSIICTITNYT